MIVVDGDDLSAHLTEDRQSSQPEIRKIEEAPPPGRVVGPRRGVLRVGVNLGQNGVADAHAHEQQQHAQHRIGNDDAPDQAVEQRGFRRGVERPGVDQCEQFAVLGPENQRRQDERGDDARRLVEDAHDAHALSRALDRTEDRHVGIGRGLEDRQPRTDAEQSEQKNLELTEKGRRDENESPQGRKHESVHDSTLEAHLFQQDAGGYGHDEIGDVEGEGDEIGLEMGELAAYPEIGNQDGVHPRNGSEDEEHTGQNTQGEEVVSARGGNGFCHRSLFWWFSVNE